MKKLLLIICCAFGTSLASFAQCIPDLSITTPGIYPDTATNLPGGISGVFYDSDIQVMVFSDTAISPGLVVTVDDITVDSVGGLPAGFAYSCNPANCVFPGGSNGCLRLFGTNATPGTYDLTVYVTLHGTLFGFPVEQATTITGYHIILSAPVAPVAAFSSVSATICEDNTVTFINQSQNNPTSYLWTFPGGTPATSTDAEPEVLYSNSGTFDVTLEVTNAAGTDVVTQTNYLTINPKPVATVSPAGNQSFCAGQSITLTANTGVGLNYQWYRYGNLLAGETNQTLSVSDGGTYKVRVTDSGTGCSKRSGLRTITILPLPSISITGLTTTTICKNESVVLQAATGVGNTIEWTSGGNTIPGATGTSYEATSSSYYRARATSADGCVKLSNGIVVNVLPLPDNSITASGPLTFCVGDSVVLSAQAVVGNTYQWEQNFSPIPGETGTTYTATSSGKYTFTVTGANGCFRTSAVRKVVVNCREAISGAAAQFETAVYPNPASDNFQVELTNPATGNVVVEMYDMAGRNVSTPVNSVLESGLYTFEIDASQFPEGVYVIKTSAGSDVDFIKIVIE